MTAEESPSGEPDTENSDGLLFAWRDKRRVLFHLGIFIFFSLLLHLTGFYLFQVIYPSSGRLEPEPTRVTILNESQPAVSTLLREIEDRLVFLKPASGDSDVRVSVNDFTVQFEPSFSDRTVPFQQAHPIAEIRQLGGPMIADPIDSDSRSQPELFFPPTTKVRDSPEEAESIPPNRWAITGDLGARPIRAEDSFEKALPQLAGPPAVRFSIAADPSGNLRYILPVAGESNPDLKAVIGAVRQNLRFEPLETPTDELQWGWLEIPE